MWFLKYKRLHYEITKRIDIVAALQTVFSDFFNILILQLQKKNNIFIHMKLLKFIIEIIFQLLIVFCSYFKFYNKNIKIIQLKSNFEEKSSFVLGKKPFFILFFIFKFYSYFISM